MKTYRIRYIYERQKSQNDNGTGGMFNMWNGHDKAPNLVPSMFHHHSITHTPIPSSFCHS